MCHRNAKIIKQIIRMIYIEVKKKIKTFAAYNNILYLSLGEKKHHCLSDEETSENWVKKKLKAGLSFSSAFGVGWLLIGGLRLSHISKHPELQTKHYCEVFIFIRLLTMAAFLAFTLSRYGIACGRSAGLKCNSPFMNVLFIFLLNREKDQNIYPFRFHAFAEMYYYCRRPSFMMHGKIHTHLSYMSDHLSWQLLTVWI